MKVIAGIPGKTHAFQQHQGFTIVELIITITIVGILAGVALPRFVSRGDFDSVGFTDQVESITRYAQKSAIAMRRNVCVTLTVDTITLNYAVLCNTALNLPGTQVNTLNAPNGVTLAWNIAEITPGTAQFYFDPLGRPFNATDNAALTVPLRITVNGTPLRIIIVERETGYVHQ